MPPSTKVPAKITQKWFRENIGDPAHVAKDLAAFSRAAARLSKRYPELLKQYPDEWIAVRRGRVVVHTKTHDELISHLDDHDIPRDDLFIRFMATKPRTLILCSGA